MYLFRIRTENPFSIQDFVNDAMSGAAPEKFDDESEMEYVFDNEKLVSKIMRSLKEGKITENEFDKLFCGEANTKQFQHNRNGLKRIIDNGIIPKEIPLKKSLLVSCLSKNNIVDDKDMWKRYTYNNPNKGFMLIYDLTDIDNACKIQNATFGIIDYDSKKNLDMTDYWYDWLIAYCKHSQFMLNVATNPSIHKNEQWMFINNSNINSIISQNGKTYYSKADLAFTKEKKWKWQKEYRVVVENPNYDDKKGDYITTLGMYGTTIKVKPVAIYIRNGVTAVGKQQLTNYAMLNGIKVYTETDADIYTIKTTYK